MLPIAAAWLTAPAILRKSAARDDWKPIRTMTGSRPKMQRHSFCKFWLPIGIALAALPLSVHAQNSPDAAADYQAKLAQYLRVHGAFETEANEYWNDVSNKRRIRNAKRREHRPIALDDYVLVQPPVYAGPPRPINPFAPPVPPSERPEIPVIADFLQAAKEYFDFVPERRSEAEFKRAYARAALAAGLTKQQIVRVYAFETGGNGTYDTQAGVTPARTRAISPAIGYNQLLSTNTVSILAEQGHHFVATLRRKAQALSGSARSAMERKIEALKRMVDYSRTIPPRWSEYDRIAKHTPKGFGMHAAILDIDIGPLLQVQKLLDSVRFARAKGYAAPLSAAELELMNLTGDGNGFDMVTMPPSMRERVPTANFFQPQGYYRNPVARRTKVVAGLIAEMEATMARGAQAPGARDLAASF